MANRLGPEEAALYADMKARWESVFAMPKSDSEERDKLVSCYADWS
jgi:hypothetical protein